MEENAANDRAVVRDQARVSGVLGGPGADGRQTAAWDRELLRDTQTRHCGERARCRRSTRAGTAINAHTPTGPLASRRDDSREPAIRYQPNRAGIRGGGSGGAGARPSRLDEAGRSQARTAPSGDQQKRSMGSIGLKPSPMTVSPWHAVSTQPMTTVTGSVGRFDRRFDPSISGRFWSADWGVSRAWNRGRSNPGATHNSDESTCRGAGCGAGVATA